MDFQEIAAIFFVILLLILWYIKRKDVQVDKIIFPAIYFLMYRTKVALKMMDSWAKKIPRIIEYAAYLGVLLGFVGMIFLAVSLVISLYNMLFVPGAVPGVMLVLPFKVKGVLYVPFFYWIISVFIIAFVHEFAHGVVMRRYNVKIKSSGIAALAIFAPFILAAFVEPDEKNFNKKKKREQLSVLAAGPFANIVFGFIVLLLLWPLANAGTAMMDQQKLVVSSLNQDADKRYPAKEAGIKIDETLTEINGIQIMNVSDITQAVQTNKPGDTIIVKTDQGQYQLILGKDTSNKTKPLLGIDIKYGLKEETQKKYGEFLPNSLIWFIGLLYWIVLLSIGIGLFNLVPLGPVDGGRMLLVGLQVFFDKKRSEKIWKVVSYSFLALLALIILFIFVKPF